jgi:glutathione synthase/RimK-type ligase-like ATP-grasp enzyme
MNKIAFVTCHEIPNLTDDDRLAIPELESRGISVVPAIWNDPAVEWGAYDAVILRSMWDYHLQPQAFLAWLDQLHQSGAVVWNSTKTVRWNVDKNYLHQLEQKGIPVIPSVWLPQREEANLSEIVSQQGWQYAVVKPIVSATAHETSLVSAAEATAHQSRFSDLLSRTGTIVQEFAPEIQQTGEWSLVFFDKKYSHSMLKQPKNGDFRVQSEWGGAELVAEAPDNLIAQAQKVVDTVEDRILYARVDGIDRDGRLLLMELELIEPHLFLGFNPDAPARFASALAEIVIGKQ